MNLKEHLLTILGEEGSEIAQDCSKCLRFGMDDRNILVPDGPTNEERLINELNDLFGVVCLLVQNGILPPDWQSEEKMKAKMERVLKFLQYSKKVGTLDHN